MSTTLTSTEAQPVLDPRQRPPRPGAGAPLLTVYVLGAGASCRLHIELVPHFT